jgi:small subunit ribosomal protein S20
LLSEKEQKVANIKSQKKRILTNEKARLRNRAVKSQLKTAVRAVHQAINSGDLDQAQTLAEDASRLLDKAASKGVIHKNQAANRKSGVIKLVNQAAVE